MDTVLDNILSRLIVESEVSPYTYKIDNSTQDIYPETPDGDTIKVTHARSTITITHTPTNESWEMWITRKGNHYDGRMGYKPKSISGTDFKNELVRIFGEALGNALYSKMYRGAMVSAQIKFDEDPDLVDTTELFGRKKTKKVNVSPKPA